jgi:predicted nuclease of predicted toxin-antitoxin system
VKLLIDNNLPPVLGRGLAALFAGSHEVVHIRDKFGTGSLPDEKWIEALGKEGGWCVLSGDRRIATKKPSREVFLRAKLIGFFPMSAVLDLKLHALASRILAVWPIMEGIERTIEGGCFEIGIKTSRFRQIA